MIIKGKIVLKDITLQILSAENASPHYADWLNNEVINAHMESRFQEHAQDEAIAFIEVCNAKDNVLLLGIFAKGQHIGNIKADLNMQHMTAGIGILIGEHTMHSKGIGTQAIEGMCEHLFAGLDIFKINAGTYQSNVASLKAFKKAGFDLEYIKNAHVINRDGTREDVYMMVKYAKA